MDRLNQSSGGWIFCSSISARSAGWRLPAQRDAARLGSAVCAGHVTGAAAAATEWAYGIIIRFRAKCCCHLSMLRLGCLSLFGLPVAASNKSAALRRAQFDIVCRLESIACRWGDKFAYFAASAGAICIHLLPEGELVLAGETCVLIYSGACGAFGSARTDKTLTPATNNGSFVAAAAAADRAGFIRAIIRASIRLNSIVCPNLACT